MKTYMRPVTTRAHQLAFPRGNGRATHYTQKLDGWSESERAEIVTELTQSHAREDSLAWVGR